MSTTNSNLLEIYEGKKRKRKRKKRAKGKQLTAEDAEAESKRIKGMAYKPATVDRHMANRDDFIEHVKETKGTDGNLLSEKYITTAAKAGGGTVERVLWHQLPFDVVKTWIQTHRTEDGALKNIGVLKKLRATITFWAKEISKKPMSHEYTIEAQEFFKGLKKTHQAKITAGEISSKVGKDRLPKELYSRMSKAFLANRGKDGIFCAAFLTLLWNLMARSDNIDRLSFGVLDVVNDALTAEFHQTKTDQEGERYTSKKHMYANPLEPETCVVTALGVYFLVNPDIDGNEVFPGKKQQTTLTNAMTIELGTEAMQTLMKKLGHVAKDFGGHSARKGAGSHAATGSTAGPGVISISHRLGHKMGDQLDTYLKEGQASDQYVGRVVACLPINKPAFSILAPHFVGSDAEMKFVAESVELLWPALSAKTETMPAVLQRCLASVVYHSRPGGYLHETLDPKTSAVFRSSLFTEPSLRDKLDKLVVCGTEDDLKSTGSSMSPTGIPPHSMILTKLEALEKRMDDAEKREFTKDEMKSMMIEAIDEVDMERGQMTMSSVTDVFTKLLEEKLAPIENKIGVTSAVTPMELDSDSDDGESIASIAFHDLFVIITKIFFY